MGILAVRVHQVGCNAHVDQAPTQAKVAALICSQMATCLVADRFCSPKSLSHVLPMKHLQQHLSPPMKAAGFICRLKRQVVRSGMVALSRQLQARSRLQASLAAMVEEVTGRLHVHVLGQQETSQPVTGAAVELDTYILLEMISGLLKSCQVAY